MAMTFIHPNQCESLAGITMTDVGNVEKVRAVILSGETLIYDSSIGFTSLKKLLKFQCHPDGFIAAFDFHLADFISSTEDIVGV
jgi:hypothetical protein